jgi:hypothetical protein
VKPSHACVVVAVCAMFFALVPSMSAQEATATKRTGFPQDWSQHHIVFSRDGLARHPDLIYREPRVMNEVMQRWQVPNFGVFESPEPLPTVVVKSGNKSAQHRDWSQALTGHLVANAFPAKFSFYPDAPPSCTTDYVVFGLTSNGSTGHPNLVALNNLYSNPVNGGGLCDPPTGAGTGPAVLFAYDITTVAGGHITTSPILSLDGTKIGFVESIPANATAPTPASAIFHVLTWTAGQGSLAVGAVPTNMTSLPISITANDTKSSPWIDYSNDIVYMGTDDGNVYQITGVFNGTPTLSGTPWPVLVSNGFHLTPPVLDEDLGYLMVGSADGNLYQIDTTTGAVATTVGGAIGSGTSDGIAAPPIVDVTNGTTFVVTANDGASAALVEVRTSTMAKLSTAEIGLGAKGGTALNLYEPAFSNSYFTDPSTGVVRICGTGPSDTTPWQYEFGFTGVTMHEVNEAGFPVSLISTSATSRCTGWTEFFNPNIGVDGTDFFFFGLTQSCTSPTGGAADGCVASFIGNNTTGSTATITGGPSGIVIDNYSTDVQASSIYFTAVGLQEAYKFTQNGLQ